MFRRLLPACLLSMCLLSSCAMFRTPQPGIPESELIVMRGRPDWVYQEGDHHRLEWSAGEMGQYTYMAEIDANGRMLWFEQVLTDERFASLRVGQSTMSDVIRTVGRVHEMNRKVFDDGETWSYHYKENGGWDAVITVYFDRNGIVEAVGSRMSPWLLGD